MHRRRSREGERSCVDDEGNGEGSSKNFLSRFSLPFSLSRGPSGMIECVSPVSCPVLGIRVSGIDNF